MQYISHLVKEGTVSDDGDEKLQTKLQLMTAFYGPACSVDAAKITELAAHKSLNNCRKIWDERNL